MMKKICFSALLFLFLAPSFGQDYALQTFKDRRVINMHSTETLPKRKLDVRIVHRFGDLLGDRGGFPTFYGLEEVADVVIGAEYGFTDNFTAGIFRSKGGGRLPDGTRGLNQLANLVGKYRILRQTQDGSMPLSLVLVGTASISTAEAVDNPEIIQYFEKFMHRVAYHGQLLVARKYSDAFSLQLSAGYTYRNIVPFGDENGLFSVGGASRIQVSKVFGVLLDATFPISDMRTSDNGFYPALGLGLEIDTGGHVFQVNFTNATQIMETDYIPYTVSDWGAGEFRLGFTISRLFNL